jgi:hypothetical protein
LNEALGTRLVGNEWVREWTLFRTTWRKKGPLVIWTDTSGETLADYTPLVWKLYVPSRLHIFLLLLAKNKVLTRDNLAKRKKLDDLSCLFCTESESVSHLFFDCCVAQVT